MATYLRNNTGGNLVLPDVYGAVRVPMSRGVVINDSVLNVAYVLQTQPGDGIILQEVPDGQPGSITPNPDPYAVLVRTPAIAVNAMLTDGLRCMESYLAKLQKGSPNFNNVIDRLADFA